MENLFPIRYWINLPMKTNFLSMRVSSSTIPFRFNNEWYTITQEDSKFVSTMRIYTINKLPAIHPPMFPSTISSTAININEIEEVTKFMMNAAIEEYQKRKAQQFVLGFPNLSIEPIFVNDSVS
ncbi:CLUMA_CG003716, isoform A [Clunio marinus]|uniref:CLUMA_CG003716, isoform A n=1 Tax=Clunio marinus TaxID=568069 RepID=A0A1J1HU17_9DIPT|nr:CLUMA_CG003716, isoform A [Clunio marinus]